MELESLKEIWNHSGASGKEVSGEEVRRILRRQSGSSIAKMKRNLKIELAVMVVLYAYVVFRDVHAVPGMLWLLLLVIEAAYLVYFGIKYRLLNRMECSTCEVRSNLQQQLKSLERLLRFYLWSGIVLIPLVVLCSFWIGYSYDPPTGLPQEAYVVFPLLALAFVVLSLLLCIPLFYFTKWYIRKLYGRHIDKLKEMIHDLKEEEITNQ